MNPRERVLAAIDHQVPDMVPVHIMGIEAPELFYEHFEVSTIEEVRAALGLDTWRIANPEYIGPEISEGMTIWGTRSHANNTGYSESRGGHPLWSATTVREVERYDWPSADNLDFTVLEPSAKEAGELARIVGFWWEPVFCRLLDLFGMEEAMVKMHTHPAVVEAAVSHIVDYILEISKPSLECTAGLADIFWYGDDFSTQNGLMLSPEHWRKFLKPAYQRIFDLGKSRGLKLWFHSCGSFAEVLPDLVDMGIDVWETCQVHLKDNDPHYLKREFGDRLAFYGAINTQQTLPFGSAGEVRREVGERIEVLGRDGGYICGPDHTVRPEVPVENVLALVDAVRKYRSPQRTLSQ